MIRNAPIAVALVASAMSLLSACGKSAASPVQDGTPIDAVRLAMPQSEGLPAPRDVLAKAAWTGTPDGTAARFGYAGEGPLLTVACRSGVLMVTRHAYAEVGAQALFALQGGGHILRLPVDATSLAGQRGYLWQGALNPGDPGAAVFQGAFNGTLPGGGMIKVTSGEPLRAVMQRCKANPAVAAPVSSAQTE